MKILVVLVFIFFSGVCYCHQPPYVLLTDLELKVLRVAIDDCKNRNIGLDNFSVAVEKYDKYYLVEFLGKPRVSNAELGGGGLVYSYKISIDDFFVIDMNKHYSK